MLKKVLAPEGQILFFLFPGGMVQGFVHKFGGEGRRKHTSGYRLQRMVFQHLPRTLGRADGHDYPYVGPLARPGRRTEITVVWPPRRRCKIRCGHNVGVDNGARYCTHSHTG